MAFSRPQVVFSTGVATELTTTDTLPLPPFDVIDNAAMKVSSPSPLRSTFADTWESSVPDVGFTVSQG